MCVNVWPISIKRAGKILFGKKEPTEWIPE